MLCKIHKEDEIFLDSGLKIIVSAKNCKKRKKREKSSKNVKKRQKSKNPCKPLVFRVFSKMPNFIRDLHRDFSPKTRFFVFFGGSGGVRVLGVRGRFLGSGSGFWGPGNTTRRFREIKGGLMSTLDHCRRLHS